MNKTARKPGGDQARNQNPLPIIDRQEQWYHDLTANGKEAAGQ